MQRRILLQSATSLLTLGIVTHSLAQAPAKPTVEVWKSPTCGCCKDWVKHMESNGFSVTTHEVGEAEKTAMRNKLGLINKFGSCHTALVGGYVVEGHVPADMVHRLLKERPKAVGLAVPGMPIGSPGMDGPEYGGQKNAYSVLLVQRNGASIIYKSYNV
jgi:hypothetical protein